MSESAEKILQEALELTHEEQLELAYQLLRSVRGPRNEDEEPLREMLERRVDELVPDTAFE